MAHNRHMENGSGHFSIPFAAMASHCEVRIGAASQAHARHVAQIAIDEVLRIETTYSRYRPDSIISRINAAAGDDWVELDAESAALFNYADTLFQVSGGLFDITSGILRRAWDFRHAQLPDNDALRALLPFIGWQSVQRREESGKHYIYLPKDGMEIDFGGFGKEYAADCAAALLINYGLQSGYVNLGGDLHVIGPQPNGEPWMIGIQDPRQTDAVIASIPISSGALATSGDYERFFEVDGKRYCHILDPRSGWPVQKWRSVSVLAPLAIAAGSHATLAMLKEQAGIEFLQESGLAYLAVDNEDGIHRQDMHKFVSETA